MSSSIYMTQLEFLTAAQHQLAWDLAAEHSPCPWMTLEECWVEDIMIILCIASEQGSGQDN